MQDFCSVRRGCISQSTFRRSTGKAAACSRSEFRLTLHRNLGLKAFAISVDRRYRFCTTRVLKRTTQSLAAMVAFDCDLVPFFRVPNVIDRDVVMLPPEKGNGSDASRCPIMLSAAVWPWRSATTQCSTRICAPEYLSGQRAMSPAAYRKDPKDSRAERPNTSPDRVSGSQRKGLQGQAQQSQARGHADHREQGWNRACEPFRIFQSDSPADFEKAGEKKEEPSHQQNSSLWEGRHYRDSLNQAMRTVRMRRSTGSEGNPVRAADAPQRRAPVRQV